MTNWSRGYIDAWSGNGNHRPRSVLDSDDYKRGYLLGERERDLTGEWLAKTTKKAPGAPPMPQNDPRRQANNSMFARREPASAGTPVDHPSLRQGADERTNARG